KHIFALCSAVLGSNTHFKILFRTVRYHFAEKLCKLRRMLSLFKRITLICLGNLGITLPVGYSAHGKVHPYLHAFAVEIGAKPLNDLTVHALCRSDNMLAS